MRIVSFAVFALAAAAPAAAPAADVKTDFASGRWISGQGGENSFTIVAFSGELKILYATPGSCQRPTCLVALIRTEDPLSYRVHSPRKPDGTTLCDRLVSQFDRFRLLSIGSGDFAARFEHSETGHESESMTFARNPAKNPVDVLPDPSGERCD
jgi:hypothetical protein